MSSPFGNIEVRGAREHNLKSVSLDIPRRQITVFTGLSGSGKSSLVFDTIAAESQRLINETFSTFVQMFLPRYGQPDADALNNLSTAIIVDQQPLGGNPRSTLGTATDVYTMFRVLFGRIGSPKVSHPLALSFNNPLGMCPECEGLAQVSKVDIDELIDKSKSLAEGPIRFPTFHVDGYHWAIFANSGFFNLEKKLGDYTKAEWERFLYLDDPKLKVKSLGKMQSPYEGLVVKFKRLYLGKDAGRMVANLRVPFERIVTRGPCDACGGTRLAEAARACKIEGKSIADVSRMPILLDRMVDNGSTVIVIEHNLGVVARADWVVDMGPGAGNDGGTIVFEGVPARLVQHRPSLTGQHLAKRVA